ncbi:MAG: phosphoadenylyl-sulfate reductase [Pseudomonadota bacterium]
MTTQGDRPAPPHPAAPALAEAAAALDLQLTPLSAEARIAAALSGAVPGPVALVSSFGADAAVLLHMVAQIDRATPVLFLDTQMLFAETLSYQHRLAALLGLTDVRRLTPDPEALALEDPEGDLHQRGADACCALRKTEPLARALAPFGASITGRKRHQAATRARMAVAETDHGGRLKLNPLADWTAAQLSAYRLKAGLPAHPLVARGYPSIGCAPCTTPVREGEDPRAGRWRGSEKTECGIHFLNGRLQRGE